MKRIISVFLLIFIVTATWGTTLEANEMEGSEASWDSTIGQQYLKNDLVEFEGKHFVVKESFTSNGDINSIYDSNLFNELSMDDIEITNVEYMIDPDLIGTKLDTNSIELTTEEDALLSNNVGETLYYKNESNLRAAPTYSKYKLLASKEYNYGNNGQKNPKNLGRVRSYNRTIRDGFYTIDGSEYSVSVGLAFGPANVSFTKNPGRGGGDYNAVATKYRNVYTRVYNFNHIIAKKTKVDIYDAYSNRYIRSNIVNATHRKGTYYVALPSNN